MYIYIYIYMHIYVSLQIGLNIEKRSYIRPTYICQSSHVITKITEIGYLELKLFNFFQTVG